jgi:hypothetical protein
VPSDLYRFQQDDHEPVSLTVNAQTHALNISKGYATIRRRWQQGDRIVLHLPMPVRRIRAHEKVNADAGRLALQRGPIVYCAEGLDNSGHVLNLVLRNEAELQAHFQADLLQGVQMITGQAHATQRSSSGQDLEMTKQPFSAIPYYAWAHRGSSEMAVWLAEEAGKAKPLFGPSLASTSKVSSSGGEGNAALNDDKIPGAKPVHGENVFIWATREDTSWVQYHFTQTEEVSEAQVYWYDNGTTCRVPKSWRLLARFNGEWHRVWADNRPWGVEKNTFNKIIFETARTDTLRMEVLPQPNATAGVLEWRVY